MGGIVSARFTRRKHDIRSELSGFQTRYMKGNVQVLKCEMTLRTRPILGLNMILLLLNSYSIFFYSTSIISTDISIIFQYDRFPGKDPGIFFLISDFVTITICFIQPGISSYFHFI